MVKQWILALSVLFSSIQSKAIDYLCYLHGAQGVSPYFLEQVVPALQNLGVPVVVFETSYSKTIEARAIVFSQGMSDLIEYDSDAHCHLLGYSMGGLVARYALNHLTIKVPGSEEKIPLSSRVKTLATVSTPHYGTPLAELLQENYPEMIPALEELSEAGMEKYNDPSSSSYSPAIEGMPTWSFSTYVDSQDELPQITTKIGFEYLTKVLDRRGLDSKNDGIVPTSSMRFGDHVLTMKISHYFMTHHVPGTYNAIDFISSYWNQLTL